MMAGDAVRKAELPGRGRALVAARAIREGEVVLSDSPLLVYPASLASIPSFCSHCFRSLAAAPSSRRCAACRSAAFCSAACLSLSHPSLLCAALAHPSGLLGSAAAQDQDQLLFLLSAYSLPAPSLHLLLSLSSPPTTPSADQNIHSLVASLAPSHLLPPAFSPEVTAALLAKDRTNAFGLMEPFRPEVPQGLRSARAYALYPRASLLNHDCLPNACHFDYVDRPGGGNTDILVRALHDIPEGREVCISYFAANWSYADRQRKLLEDYGFRCECDRCRIESQWKQDENEGEEDDAMEEEEGGGKGDNDEMDQEEEEDAGGDDEDFPHAYFFVRYLCDRENCGGTLAPLPPLPQGTPSHVLECNVCGQLRKEGDDAPDGDAADSQAGKFDQASALPAKKLEPKAHF